MIESLHIKILKTNGYFVKVEKRENSIVVTYPKVDIYKNPVSELTKVYEIREHSFVVEGEEVFIPPYALFFAIRADLFSRCLKLRIVKDLIFYYNNEEEIKEEEFFGLFPQSLSKEEVELKTLFDYAQTNIDQISVEEFKRIGRTFIMITALTLKGT